MAPDANEPLVATRKEPTVLSYSKPLRINSLLLILAIWTSWAASVLLPLLLIGLTALLDQVAGVLLTGVYLFALIVLLGSGLLQLVAWICMIVLLKRRHHSTPVAIAFALGCLLGLDWMVLWFAEWASVS